MAGTSDSSTKAAQFLGLDVSQANTVMINQSTSPIELSSMLEKRSYVLAGITPKEFNDLHTTHETDIRELQTQFKKICLDYGKPLEWEGASRAVEFCSKVIFEVGPESRQIKKSDGDRVWKFKFLYKADDNTPYCRVAFVSTFKATQPVKQTTEQNKMILTIKQAGLLAMDTFIKLSEIIYAQNSILLMTPLAGAIFSKNDLPAISSELGVELMEVLASINSSCQSGGHMLPFGKAHIAVIASIIATKNLKDAKLQQAIVVKVARQYINNGRNIVPDKYFVYGKYAHGGLPKGMDYDSLVADFERAQIAKTPARKLAGLKVKTAMKSSGLAPATGATASGSKSPAPGSPIR